MNETTQKEVDFAGVYQKLTAAKSFRLFQRIFTQYLEKKYYCSCVMHQISPAFPVPDNADITSFGVIDLPIPQSDDQCKRNRYPNSQLLKFSMIANELLFAVVHICPHCKYRKSVMNKLSLEIKLASTALHTLWLKKENLIHQSFPVQELTQPTGRPKESKNNYQGTEEHLNDAYASDYSLANELKYLIRKLDQYSSLTELCNSILKRINKYCPSSHSLIIIEKNQSLDISTNSNILAYKGFNKKILNATDGVSITKWIARIKDTVKFHQMQSKDNSPFFTRDSTLSKMCSLTISLSSQNKEWLGALFLADPHKEVFDKKSIKFLCEYSNHITRIIRLAMDYQHSRLQAWTSSVLLHTAETAQEVHNIYDLFLTMQTITLLLSGVNRCGFFLYDSEERMFKHVVSHALDFHSELKAILVDDMHIAPIVQDRVPVILNHSSKELQSLPIVTKKNEVVKILPLQSQQALYGCMLVGMQESILKENSPELSRASETILGGIVTQTSNALKRIEILEEQAEETYVSTVLLQVTQTIVSLKNVDEILDAILNILPILVGIDLILIIKWDKSAKSYSIWKMSDQSSQIEEKIFTTAMSSKAAEFFDSIRVSNSYQTTSLSEFTKGFQSPHIDSTGAGLSSVGNSALIGFPISHQNDFFGILLTKESNVSPQFHLKRVEILSGVAQQIGLSIQNTILGEDAREKDKLQKEIQLARKIQLTFLPEKLLKLKSWNMAVRWITARQVGGDFYDYFQLDDSNVALAIADVADKGLPASLYMTVTRTLIRAHSRNAVSPAMVLTKVNEQLLLDSPNSLFVTAVLGFLNLSTGRLTYTIAGHPLPLVIRSKTHTITPLTKCGMALGISDSANLIDRKTTLLKNDTLIFYSDGLTDCVDMKMKSYDEDRLVRLLESKTINTAEDALSLIEKDLKKFRGDAAIVDDLTILGLSRE